MITALASPARRRVALLAAAAASALALSGCQVSSPQTLSLRYAPADGVEVDGESFHVRDLLLVSHGNGAPAVISGSVINITSDELEVVVVVDGETVDPAVTVAPWTSVRLDGTAADGTPGERMILPVLESPAGMSVEVRLRAGDETLAANAPVLLPHGPYEQFADDAGGEVPPHPEADH